MNSLSEYILSVTSAATIFSILQILLDKKSSSAVLLRFIGGLFLTFTVIAPVVDLDLDIMFDLPLTFVQEADTIAADGYESSRSELATVIKQECEAYILDKARTYQVEPDIEITLSNDDTPIPTRVQLSGSITPYAKKALETWIANEIGIPEENQIWIQ